MWPRGGKEARKPKRAGRRRREAGGGGEALASLLRLCPRWDVPCDGCGGARARAVGEAARSAAKLVLACRRDGGRVSRVVGLRSAGLLVLGYWVGARRPFRVSVFLTASRMVLHQEGWDRDGGDWGADLMIQGAKNTVCEDASPPRSTLCAHAQVCVRMRTHLDDHGRARRADVCRVISRSELQVCRRDCGALRHHNVVEANSQGRHCACTCAPVPASA